MFFKRSVNPEVFHSQKMPKPLKAVPGAVVSCLIAKSHENLIYPGAFQIILSLMFCTPKWQLCNTSYGELHWCNCMFNVLLFITCCVCVAFLCGWLLWSRLCLNPLCRFKGLRVSHAVVLPAGQKQVFSNEIAEYGWLNHWLSSLQSCRSIQLREETTLRIRLNPCFVFLWILTTSLWKDSSSYSFVTLYIYIFTWQTCHAKRDAIEERFCLNGSIRKLKHP